MILKFVYEIGKGDVLLEQLTEALLDERDLKMLSYDAGYHKSRKDAIQIKASCGARLAPFCAVYNNDKELIKAFYSEVGECTFQNIINYVKTTNNS